jgi:hypothetical protein
MVAVCKDLCAFASLRLGVKFYAALPGLKYILVWVLQICRAGRRWGARASARFYVRIGESVGKFLRLRLGVR